MVLSKTGSVLTWGAAQLGQLGRNSALKATGLTDSSGLPVDPRALPVEGLPHPTKDPPVSIGAGFYNTWVALRSGALYSCGENQQDQCGVRLAEEGEEEPPQVMTMTRCSALGNMKAVAAAGGYCHTLVLTPDGDMLSMGCGDDGQRGDGRPADDPSRPAVSKVALPGGLRARQVAAGANHSIVLAEDGTAFAFGSNEYGQCGQAFGEGTGDGEDDDIFLMPHPIALPKSTESGPAEPRVVAVSAGYAHTLLTDEHGQVHTVGQNENGQLGVGAATAAAHEGSLVWGLFRGP